MQHHHREIEGGSSAQPHFCGSLFGCGEENGTGIVRGVRAMIPKGLFTGELRRQIAVV